MERTALHFIDAATGAPKPEVFDDTVVLASTRRLGWTEVVLEYGTSQGFEPDGVSVAGHFLSMNAGTTPLDIDIKYGRTFERRTLAPGDFFVQPAGVPMVQRNHGYVEWAAIEIPSTWTQRMLGYDLAVRPDCGLSDDRLESVMRCLLRELSSGCGSGPLYSEALVLAFSARLARAVGMSETNVPRGALGAKRLQAVLDRLEDALAHHVTVADLAAVAGLSVAHFSREFKIATGATPHAYIMGRRLERAHELLANGRTIAEAAAQAGFADQAHLSRAFRARYGMPPGAFQRTVRR